MNVLLIDIDTLRADRLGCYGYRLNTSPHLDKIAAEGVLFVECYASHIPTHPGHATLFTGKDVMTHQIVTQGGKVDLDPSIRQLAELLQENGYFTAAADNMGRWFSRGFEVYEGYSWSTQLEALEEGWRKAEAVNEKALRLLEQCAAQRKPWFLFLHYWDPHTPYLPPPPFNRMFYGGNEKDPNNHSADKMWAEYEPFRDYFNSWMPGVTDLNFPCRQYDAEIAYCDAVLARLFTRVDELDLWDDTLIIVTSDHGEELDEHEMWFDHHGLYDTNLRIPLILRHPSLPAGKRMYGFVQHQDFAPTILDFVGLGHLIERERMPGMSLLPLIHGDLHTGTCDVLYLSECTWMRKRGLRTHTWKLIRALEPDFHGRPPVELYHLPSDPSEQVNLAEERPEVVEELTEQLEAWRQRRMSETGLPDPLETQGITLRRVESVQVAIPANQRLVE
ncbi:MAG TPA: sulfatase [Armatimonadetes bacterium]|nr:sulfatase [Armatimonadota bacterium]